MGGGYVGREGLWDRNYGGRGWRVDREGFRER